VLIDDGRFSYKLKRHQTVVGLTIVATFFGYILFVQNLISYVEKNKKERVKYSDQIF